MPYTAAEKAAWNERRAQSAEQEELREEFETGVSPGRRRLSRKDIKIPAPKEPEVGWMTVISAKQPIIRSASSAPIA